MSNDCRKKLYFDKCGTFNLGFKEVIIRNNILEVTAEEVDEGVLITAKDKNGTTSGIVKNGTVGEIDTEMSDTSENAVQNKVIKAYVEEHSGGTDDYEALINKPKINGHEVSGEKAGADYKLQDLMTAITAPDIDEIIYG